MPDRLPDGGLKFTDPKALHDLADAMPQLVWVTSADGRIEFFNRRWYAYTGTGPQSLSADWTELLHPDDRKPALAAWQRSVATGGSYEIEYRIRRAVDGVYLWHLARGLPARDESGVIVRWFGTCTDIHDRKTAEATLQKAKSQSDSAGRAKDEFLSIVSHELRTPLSAILGWTQLLEMDVLDEAERREAVQTIKQQAKVQSQLIEDLLDVSRILNGKFQMRQHHVVLADVVAAALGTARHAAEANGVHLKRDEWLATCVVNGDPQRLQQAVTNLLNNAVKFTPKDSTITVGVTPAGSQARVTIRTDKPGVPVDQIEAIFECFKRDGGEGIREKGGLGLGLSIVRHVIDAHGGTVNAVTEAGGGTCFELRLPTLPVPVSIDAMSAGPADAAIDDSPLFGRTVLIVDDEESARSVVAAALRKGGCEVTTARDAADAWDLLSKRPFDVLVSDLGMPGHNGLDLITRIRQVGVPFRGIPAIALTGFASVDDQSRALAAGFNLHVSKPVEPNELTRQIIGLTRGR